VRYLLQDFYFLNILIKFDSLSTDDVQRFTIKYEQARDYPIDLYYLMDLTYSMKEHKEKLVELADSLGIPMFEK
jgi:hypothetical protein